MRREPAACAVAAADMAEKRSDCMEMAGAGGTIEGVEYERPLWEGQGKRGHRMMVSL